MSKNKKTKFPAGVDQVFIDEIQTLSADDLKARIVQLQILNEENEAFKESPEFLAAQEEFDYAKDRYNMVAGPIKDTSVSIKNKTKLIIERLKEKGAI